MELWDAYLEDGTLTNTKLVRGQKIPKGMFHLVSEVIVRHVDGSFLLMQRDYQKPNLPGMFEVSAGGSALVGENAYEAAVRELKEETGIVATKLEPLYTYKNNNTIYWGYLCITDCKKDSICLQKGETISYKWISKEELLHFVKSEQCSKHRTQRMHAYIEKIKQEVLINQYEVSMWEAVKIRDKDMFLALVNEDAVMVCGGYRCLGSEYAEKIANFDLASYTFYSFEVVAQTEEMIQVHYLLETKVNDKDNSDLEGMFHVTSTWKKTEDTWKLSFNMDQRVYQ